MDKLDMNELAMNELAMNELEKITILVRECGQFIKNANRASIHIDAKEGRANFVTEYDKKVQEKLREGLLSIVPVAKFIGEEGDTAHYAPTGKFFIVDPIDGTTNFIKDYKVSAISVALVVDNNVDLAVIYNPYLDEMFTAQRGYGAFCNGKKISVSVEPLSNGVVLFGTSPYHEDLAEASFRTAYSYFQKALDVRRSGSAALDLCSIAAGRAELYFELILCPWDYAAGSLIVEEAGGIATTFDGQPLRFDQPCSVLARNHVIG